MFYFRRFYFLRPAPTIGVGKNRFIMKSEISPARFFIIKSLISFLLSIKSETSPRLIIKSEISFRLSIKSSSSSPRNNIQDRYGLFRSFVRFSVREFWPVLWSVISSLNGLNQVRIRTTYRTKDEKRYGLAEDRLTTSFV